MKKVILVGCFISICFGLSAQEFQGNAEYFSKIIFKNGTEALGVNPEASAVEKDSYEEALKKASEKIFILTFNKKEALYEVRQNIEKPSAQKELNVIIRISGQGKKYINIKEGTKIIEDDIFGKDFLIVEKLESFQWKLIDESKKIGEFSCYKAEVVIPVSDKEKVEYEEYLKNQETKSTFFSMEEPKEKKIIAWYTPDIPVSVGPLNYWGLPGLILEITDSKIIILCSKVTLSNKENSKIKVPNVGAKVSQDEFDAIHKDKMESIEQR